MKGQESMGTGYNRLPAHPALCPTSWTADTPNLLCARPIARTETRPTMSVNEYLGLFSSVENTATDFFP